MPPQVDILLASYNGEKYLNQQLNSLFAQTQSNFHLLIQDDGSQDKTMDILQTWQSKHTNKISVFQSRQRLGVIGNFDSLMERTSAPYVMFCDQDDVWKPRKVELTLKEMLKLEKDNTPHTPILIHTDLHVVDAHLKPLSNSYWKYAHLTPERTGGFGQQIVQNTITGCTMMINRSLLELAHPIPCEKVVMHDWWLGLAAAAFGKIGAIPDQTLFYRQHGNNVLGAQKYNWRRLFQKEDKYRQQAKSFLDRYQNNLSQDQIVLLQAYLALKEQWLPQRVYLASKHGLWKQGFLRNFFGLLLNKL